RHRKRLHPLLLPTAHFPSPHRTSMGRHRKTTRMYFVRQIPLPTFPNRSLFGISLIAFPSAIALLAFIVLGTVLYRRRHQRAFKSNLRGLPIVVARPGVDLCEERLPIRTGEIDGSASHCGMSTSYAVPTSLDCRSIPESELDVCWSDLVGEGHFASVHEAIRRSTQDKVVIKVLHPDKRHFEEYRSDMWQLLMYNISGHRHILRILGHTSVFDTPAPVLEYCRGGHLLTYLRRKLKGQSELAVTVRLKEDRARRSGIDSTPTLADLLSFCWQICDGMVLFESLPFVEQGLLRRE
ncbi:Proto-oncogene tyrosine-protein kinase ROS, partial [Aphelenchoides avenae]